MKRKFPRSIPTKMDVRVMCAKKFFMRRVDDGSIFYFMMIPIIAVLVAVLR